MYIFVRIENVIELIVAWHQLNRIDIRPPVDHAVTYLQWHLWPQMYSERTTELYGLSRQVVFADGENKHNFVRTVNRNGETCVRLLWSHIRKFHCINSLWPSDAIWRQRSGSTLAQVMACCLTAPSHYLNQCWLIISEVQWHFVLGQFHKGCLNHQSLTSIWKLHV